MYVCEHIPSLWWNVDPIIAVVCVDPIIAVVCVDPIIAVECVDPIIVVECVDPIVAVDCGGVSMDPYNSKLCYIHKWAQCGSNHV